MSDQTPIEWTDWTWNPLAAFRKSTGKRGWFCTKVSPGCLNCYAEGLNLRLGNQLEYKDSNLPAIEWRLVNLLQPLGKKVKDGQNRVFVNSMTDLFHEAVPDHLIKVLLVVMALGSQWNFQVLTKRAQRMRKFFDRYDFGDCIAEVRSWDCGEPSGSRPWENDLIETIHDLWSRVRLRDHLEQLPNQWPLPNVWLGVSAEDQTRWDKRVIELVRTPAAVRFVSAEPLLDALDMSEILWRSGCVPHCGERCSKDADCPMEPAKLIDWLILGGESGRDARYTNIDHIRSAKQDAEAAGVAVMVKQLGKHPISAKQPREPRQHFAVGGVWRGGLFFPSIQHPKGGDMAEWPEDLRVRQFPI